MGAEAAFASKRVLQRAEPEIAQAARPSCGVSPSKKAKAEAATTKCIFTNGRYNYELGSLLPRYVTCSLGLHNQHAD